MLGGNKISYILKQTFSFFVAGLLSMYDLLLPPGIKAEVDSRGGWGGVGGVHPSFFF